MTAVTAVTALPSLAARLAVDEDRVTPGLLGFLVVAALGVATWLLVKSMRSRLRKIDVEDPDSAEEEPGRRADGAAGPPAGDEPAGRG